MFRRKKKTDKVDSESKRCESTSCPTPEVFHPKGSFFEMKGVVLCQFCYTKKLSEKPPVDDIERPKTKKTSEIALNRISSTPVQWDLSATATTNLQRIGPSQTNEKYTEELSKWTTILKSITIPNEYSNVTRIIKLNNTPNGRILETMGGHLVVSFITKQEEELKEEEELIQKQIFSTTKFSSTIHKISDFSDTIKNWINSTIIGETTPTFKDLYLRYTLAHPGKVFSLENLATEPYYDDLHALLFELGRYFYFVNFLGYKDATQLAIVTNDDTVQFVNLSHSLAKSSFADLKLSLQQLYSQIPFILDENYLESFIEGTIKQQHILQNVLESDSNEKDLILNFFEQNNIEFSLENALPSIKVFL